MNVERVKFIESDQYEGTWNILLRIDSITGQLRIRATINKNGVVHLGNSDNVIRFIYDCISEKQAWFLFYNTKTEKDIYKYLDVKKIADEK